MVLPGRGRKELSDTNHCTCTKTSKYGHEPGCFIRSIWELSSAYEGYIRILSDEIDDLVGFAATHGWESKRKEIGEVARGEIRKLKEKVFGDYL